MSGSQAGTISGTLNEAWDNLNATAGWEECSYCSSHNRLDQRQSEDNDGVDCAYDNDVNDSAKTSLMLPVGFDKMCQCVQEPHLRGLLNKSAFHSAIVISLLCHAVDVITSSPKGRIMLELALMASQSAIHFAGNWLAYELGISSVIIWEEIRMDAASIAEAIQTKQLSLPINRGQLTRIVFKALDNGDRRLLTAATFPNMNTMMHG